MGVLPRPGLAPGRYTIDPHVGLAPFSQRWVGCRAGRRGPAGDATDPRCSTRNGRAQLPLCRALNEQPLGKASRSFSFQSQRNCSQHQPPCPARRIDSRSAGTCPLDSYRPDVGHQFFPVRRPPRGAKSNQHVAGAKNHHAPAPWGPHAILQRETNQGPPGRTVREQKLQLLLRRRTRTPAEARSKRSSNPARFEP